MNIKNGIIIGTITAVVGGSALIIGGAFLSDSYGKKPETQNPVETAYKEPEKKIDEPFVPEPIVPKQEPKVEPKEEPKEEPKPEAPKWEAKPVAYESSVTYENPVTRAIAMEQYRVEATYRKVTGEQIKETELARIYRFSAISGEDNVVQRKELKTSDLEAKVEELRKKDNKPYEELNMGSLSISDKADETSRISIMPENEAQEKRLLALKETYKTPKQAAYIAAMLQLNSADQKIGDERLTYVEKKAAEKYGGKK